MSTFKKCSVVMLPTNEKASLKLGQNGLLVNNTLGYDAHFINQYLYILSNDEIKEGDWCIYIKQNQNDTLDKTHIFKADKKSICKDKKTVNNSNNTFYFDYECKKIIATTDSSLWEHDDTVPYPKTRPALPQPSQAFIEKYVEEYNKGNIITDVLVEYKELTQEEKRKQADGVNTYPTHKIKINSKDNTITIKKVKDSWSREEVEQLCRYAYRNGYWRAMGHSDTLDEEYWIEENL